MSATLMGAVMDCGPTRLRLRLALVGIADNADDFGFASLSIETIATKAICDRRHAMRVVQELEREGWLRVHRRANDGKGSVYFINLDKLGVVPSEKSRKSEWHFIYERRMARKSGDKMSPEPAAAPKPTGKRLEWKELRESGEASSESGDNLTPVDSPFLPAESGDNSQGVQVTFCADSGDILPLPILKNRKNHLNPNNTPLPPSQASGSGSRKASSADAETRNAVGHACPEAVGKVGRELGVSDERMLRVIAKAMALEHAKYDIMPHCNDTAECMIASRRRFVQHTHLMRYNVGLRKFFAHGLWCDEDAWPWDQQRLREVRRL